MPEYQIRPIGRPKVERASNGLRRITRRYVVQGEAVAAGNIESQVFLAFGTVDAEYASLSQDLGPGYQSGTYTSDLGSETINAYLIQQSVEPSQEVTQAFLTRVYQELDASSDPVQVDKDVVKVSDSGRISVQRMFIVKNPYTDHYDPARVGVDYLTITHDSTDRKCYLGKVESKENEVFTEFTETFFEDAVLSETIEYRNGIKGDVDNPHRLEIRTIRGMKGTSALDEPDANEGPGDSRWYLVSEREGPGSAQFGQTGRPVTTKVWAKGEGVVNFNSNVKHDGALEIVSIRSLGKQSGVEDANPDGPDSTVSKHNGAKFHRVNSTQQESSGHRMFMDTYAAGHGRIAKSTDDRGGVVLVSETWLTEPGAELDRGTLNVTEELHDVTAVSVSKKDGYDLHAINGKSEESGVANTRWQYKHYNEETSAGAGDDYFDLEICNITKIGAKPTTADAASDRPAKTNGADFVLIAESKDLSGRFDVYTGTFAAGKGIIQTGERNTGSLTIKSFSSLNTAFPASSYDQSTLDRDGYALRSYKTYELDGDFTSNETKQWINKWVYKGTHQTLTASVPGISSLTPLANDVSGSYAVQSPGIWRTTDTDVSVDSSGGGFLSRSARRNVQGNYTTQTDVVASEAGVDAVNFKPNLFSVLVAETRTFERGWVRDQFTWVYIVPADGDDFVWTLSKTNIPWTLPGLLQIAGEGRLATTDPQKVSLPVGKTTVLTTTQPPPKSVLQIPWSRVDATIVFKAKKDPYILDRTYNNWCWKYNTTAPFGAWTTFKGFAVASTSTSAPGGNPLSSDSDIGQVDNYNIQAGGGTHTYHNYDAAFLSYDVSIFASDDLNNIIYKLDMVQGAPTIATT